MGAATAQLHPGAVGTAGGHWLRSLMVPSAPGCPHMPVVWDLSPRGEGWLRAEAAMPALITPRHIPGLLAERP